MVKSLSLGLLVAFAIVILADGLRLLHLFLLLFLVDRHSEFFLFGLIQVLGLVLQFLKGKPKFLDAFRLFLLPLLLNDLLNVLLLLPAPPVLVDFINFELIKLGG